MTTCKTCFTVTVTATMLLTGINLIQVSAQEPIDLTGSSLKRKQDDFFEKLNALKHEAVAGHILSGELRKGNSGGPIDRAGINLVELSLAKNLAERVTYCEGARIIYDFELTANIRGQDRLAKEYDAKAGRTDAQIAALADELLTLKESEGSGLDAGLSQRIDNLKHKIAALADKSRRERAYASRFKRNAEINQTHLEESKRVHQMLILERDLLKIQVEQIADATKVDSHGFADERLEKNRDDISQALQDFKKLAPPQPVFSDGLWKKPPGKGVEIPPTTIDSEASEKAIADALTAAEARRKAKGSTPPKKKTLDSKPGKKVSQHDDNWMRTLGALVLFGVTDAQDSKKPAAGGKDEKSVPPPVDPKVAEAVKNMKAMINKDLPTLHKDAAKLSNEILADLDFGIERKVIATQKLLLAGIHQEAVASVKAIEAERADLSAKFLAETRAIEMTYPHYKTGSVDRQNFDKEMRRTLRAYEEPLSELVRELDYYRRLQSAAASLLLNITREESSLERAYNARKAGLKSRSTDARRKIEDLLPFGRPEREDDKSSGSDEPLDALQKRVNELLAPAVPPAKK